jgi:hypothetical protein
MRHAWHVCARAEADERAVTVLAPYPNIAAFRFGHPCWRKITDPLLFGAPGEEMIILDPDLYFRIASVSSRHLRLACC